MSSSPLSLVGGILLLVASLPASHCFQNGRYPLTNLQHHTAPHRAKSHSDESTNYNYIGLNTNTKPYVPSGLSPDQYEKIKEDEAAKLSKMNFGAWGPRFKQTDVPDGDWMVQTNLWIKGFQSGSRADLSVQEMELQETRRQQLVAVKTTVTSFLLAYLVLDILLYSFASVRSASSTKKLLSSLLARQGILYVLRQHAMATLVVGKLQCLKLAAASVAVPVVSKYRENSYRKLWSKRRTFGTPILASLMMVGIKLALGMGLAALR